MSAPNFYQRNANRLFVIEPEQCEDMGLWQDTMTDLTDIAMEHGFEHNNNSYIRGFMHESYGSSYHASQFGCMWRESIEDKLGNYWNVHLVPVIRSGYFAGACLDFCIELTSECSDVLNDEDVFNGNAIEDTIDDYLHWLQDTGEIEDGEQSHQPIAQLAY